MGLRVDHIDGLRDPAGYLKRLQERLSSQRRARRSLLVVEKILEREDLPRTGRWRAPPGMTT